VFRRWSPVASCTEKGRSPWKCKTGDSNNNKTIHQAAEAADRLRGRLPASPSTFNPSFYFPFTLPIYTSYLPYSPNCHPLFPIPTLQLFFVMFLTYAPIFAGITLSYYPLTVFPTKCHGWALTLPLSIQEVPDSNLGLETKYPDRGFSWFSSVSPGKCGVTT
jgi:hypothetical protein